MPTLPKKMFYIRLLYGAGAIVGGLAVLILEFFVFNRVYILLTLFSGAAILGGLLSPLFLKDWACAACGEALDFSTFYLVPGAAAVFNPALASRNVPQMASALAGSSQAGEGNEVTFHSCEKCQRSVMISANSAKDVVFLDQEAQALIPAMRALVVESKD